MKSYIITLLGTQLLNVPEGKEIRVSFIPDIRFWSPIVNHSNA